MPLSDANVPTIVIVSAEKALSFPVSSCPTITPTPARRVPTPSCGSPAAADRAEGNGNTTRGRKKEKMLLTRRTREAPRAGPAQKKGPPKHARWRRRRGRRVVAAKRRRSSYCTSCSGASEQD